VVDCHDLLMLRVTIEHQLKNARMVEPEPDAVDQANSALEKESLHQPGKQEQQLLRMIESALGRIRDGSFGHCVSFRNEEIDRNDWKPCRGRRTASSGKKISSGASLTPNPIPMLKPPTVLLKSIGGSRTTQMIDCD
jgi:hypothetical protein